MAELVLPEKIYYGIGSLDRIFDRDYQSVLIASDGDISQKSGALLEIERKFLSLMTKTHTAVSALPQELFEQCRKYVNTQLPDVIVGIGNAQTLDAVRAVSYFSGTPFIAVPECAPSALLEFDTLDVFLCRNMPSVCILDPDFINRRDSSGIAYEAFGTVCLCLESAVYAEDSYVSACAVQALESLFRNILPSYRGEISARENLLKAMYAAFWCYENTFSYSWESPSYLLSSFFSRRDIPKLSVLASALPFLFGRFREHDETKLFSACRALTQTPDDAERINTALHEIRKVQAILSVPSSVKNFSISEEEFERDASALSERDRELYEKCFNSNTVFVKK